MKTVKLVTLGCRVNLYESDALAGLLEKAGYQVVKEGTADWLILNTCTVTDEAGRKCRQTLRRLHRENPEMKILVCGCYSQMLRDKAKELMPEADILCGNGEKDRIPDFLKAFDEKNNRDKEFYTGDIMEKRDFDHLLLTDYKGRGIRFTGDCMEFSALPWTPHEIENAAHGYELPPVHYTVVRAALMQMGVAGDDSWGARTHEEYLIDVSKPLRFEFSFTGKI